MTRIVQVVRRSLFLLALGALPVAAQTALPQWRLSEPRLEIGRDEVELHRVSAAALLSGGRVAIADGGSHRILMVSPQGRVIRQIGREGRGPGDIAHIVDLAVFGDTLAAYDSGLQRITLWDGNGELLGSNRLPGVLGRTPMVVAMLSTSDVVVSYTHNADREPTGLFLQKADLFQYRGQDDRLSPLGTRDWRYEYMYREEHGWTSYYAGFLGETLLAANGGRWISVALGSRTVEFIRPDGTPGASVQVPEPQVPFDRVLVDLYRDSLLAAQRRGPAGQYPGAIERLEAVYGPTFPVPERRSVLAKARTVGPHVWLQAFPARQDPNTTWYAVDVAGERLLARLSLPRSWQVLGGDLRSVLVLRRDEFDTEYVALHDIVRSRD